MEGPIEVVDMEIVSMELAGASTIGAITVSERPGASFVSSGEIREKAGGTDFPASSSFDVFADIVVPADPNPTLQLHNNLPLRMVANPNLGAWPPLGANYEMEPIYQFDDDGDTQVDEDSSDDDGDLAFDEDPPGNGNQDTDALTDEDPAFAQCTLVLCDDDSDGEIDEDPGCVPLFTEANSSLPAGYCVRDMTMEIAPEMPSFSVAPGGPSNLHPADILALTPGVPPSPPPPPPTNVSGNDNFANADIAAVPFIGQQNTASFTIELHQCGNTTDDDGDGLVNDGCAAVSAARSISAPAAPTTTRTAAVNDGCPTAGPAGSARPVQQQRSMTIPATRSVNDGCVAVASPEVNQCGNATDDDGDGRINDGCPSPAQPNGRSRAARMPGNYRAEPDGVVQPDARLDREDDHRYARQATSTRS